MRELYHKEDWVLKNWLFQTVVLEKTLESPLDCKEIIPVNPKGKQPWIFIGRTDAKASALVTWCKELIHWKRSWCWERLRIGEGDNRGWMASSTQWTEVWANWWRKWRTRKPGVLQPKGSQRVKHDLVTEQQNISMTTCHLTQIPW